jgi:hypothetical protein
VNERDRLHGTHFRSGAPGQALKILIPFYGQEIFLFGIAFLAGGDDISLRTSATSAEGNHVIHGQLRPPHFMVAVIANALLDFAVPPVRASHAAGLFLFPLDVVITDKIGFK